MNVIHVPSTEYERKLIFYYIYFRSFLLLRNKIKNEVSPIPLPNPIPVSLLPRSEHCHALVCNQVRFCLFYCTGIYTATDSMGHFVVSLKFISILLGCTF